MKREEMATQEQHCCIASSCCTCRAALPSQRELPCGSSALSPPASPAFRTRTWLEGAQCLKWGEHTREPHLMGSVMLPRAVSYWGTKINTSKGANFRKWECVKENDSYFIQRIKMVLKIESTGSVILIAWKRSRRLGTIQRPPHTYKGLQDYGHVHPLGCSSPSRLLPS